MCCSNTRTSRSPLYMMRVCVLFGCESVNRSSLCVKPEQTIFFLCDTVIETIVFALSSKNRSTLLLLHFHMQLPSSRVTCRSQAHTRGQPSCSSSQICQKASLRVAAAAVGNQNERRQQVQHQQQALSTGCVIQLAQESKRRFLLLLVSVKATTLRTILCAKLFEDVVPTSWC